MGALYPPAELDGPGIRNVKKSEASSQFREAGQEDGREASYYYTLGQYDLVATVKLPDDESVLKLGIELRRLGNVRITTFKGWTSQEMAGMISSLQD